MGRGKRYQEMKGEENTAREWERKGKVRKERWGKGGKRSRGGGGRGLREEEGEMKEECNGTCEC